MIENLQVFGVGYTIGLRVPHIKIYKPNLTLNSAHGMSLKATLVNVSFGVPLKPHAKKTSMRKISKFDRLLKKVGNAAGVTT